MANDKKTTSPIQTAETKQGAITPADFQSPKRIRIPGFRGAFMDAHFDDEGNSEATVSPNTIVALQKQFPQITVEEI